MGFKIKLGFKWGLTMENELLTIKDFADLAGVSVQSIYKKLRKENNPIQRYLKVVDGVKYIDRKAYTVLYSPAAAPTTEKASQIEAKADAEQTPPPKSSTDRILDILEQQLEEQRRQLQEKDNQIAEQNAQINSLLARLEESSRIINQQQQLTAMNTKALMKADSTTAEAEQVPPPKVKASIWERLFRKDAK